MDAPSAKYGGMKKVGGKVDSGSAMGDRQIPPGISSGGQSAAKQGVESPLNTSKAQIPPMNANPVAKPTLD